jgi:hypothetical protein
MRRHRNGLGILLGYEDVDGGCVCLKNCLAGCKQHGATGLEVDGV